MLPPVQTGEGVFGAASYLTGITFITNLPPHRVSETAPNQNTFHERCLGETCPPRLTKGYEGWDGSSQKTTSFRLWHAEKAGERAMAMRMGSAR